MATKFVKPRFVIPENVAPRRGVVTRTNGNKGLAARGYGASWDDISNAYNIKRGRLIDLFNKLGITRRVTVGETKSTRIQVNGLFSDRGFAETFMARGSSGQWYSQSVVLDEGLKFIARHYYDALIELSKNKKATGASLIKKFNLQPFTVLK